MKMTRGLEISSVVSLSFAKAAFKSFYCLQSLHATCRSASNREELLVYMKSVHGRSLVLMIVKCVLSFQVPAFD